MRASCSREKNMLTLVSRKSMLMSEMFANAIVEMQIIRSTCEQMPMFIFMLMVNGNEKKQTLGEDFNPKSLPGRSFPTMW